MHDDDSTFLYLQHSDPNFEKFISGALNFCKRLFSPFSTVKSRKDIFIGKFSRMSFLFLSTLKIMRTTSTKWQLESPWQVESHTYVQTLSATYTITNNYNWLCLSWLAWYFGHAASPNLNSKDEKVLIKLKLNLTLNHHPDSIKMTEETARGRPQRGDDEATQTQNSRRCRHLVGPNARAETRGVSPP